MATDLSVQSRVEFTPDLKSLERALAQVRKNPVKIQIQSDANSIKNLNNGLGSLSRSTDEFSKSIEAANARVIAFGASVGVIVALQQGFSNLVRSTIEVEKAFKAIEVVGDQFAATQGDLAKFGRGIFDVARETAQSFDATAKAALEFARQGLGAEETLKRTRDALILTRVSGIDAVKSVESLTAAVNAFKKEGLTTTTILNKLIAVDNKYAVSSADLAEAIQRSGSFAQDTGVKFDELVATTTVLQEVTSRGGSVIGNSLKTIFERVRRPESLNQLTQLGVEVADLQGNILPAIKIIDNFAKKISSIGEEQRAGALRQLAGTFQINQLSALVGVLGEAEGAANRYDEVLRTASGASIEAERANAKLNETLAASVQSFLTTATQFGSSFGGQSFLAPFKEVVGGATTILGNLEGVFSEGGSDLAKALAKTFGEILSGPGLSIAIAAAGVFAIKFGQFALESFKSFFKLNQASQQQNAIQASILNIMRSRSDIEAVLIGQGNNEIAQARILKQIYEDIALAETKRANISKTAAANFVNAGLVMGSSGFPIPKNAKRAAGGFVPGLVQAEYNDIQKGVGGANKSSNVVMLNNFPFGGGKKGTMVANSSEAIVPMGNGSAAVLNKNMMDKMGYGKRAADGDIPNLSLAGATVASRSGKFAPVKKIEGKIEELSRSLTEQSKSGLEFSNAIRSALKEFELTAASVKSIVKESNAFSAALKKQGVAAKEAYELALRENAQKRQQASARAAQELELDRLQKEQLANLLNKPFRTLPPPTGFKAPVDPAVLAGIQDDRNLQARIQQSTLQQNRDKAFMSVPNLGGSIDPSVTTLRVVQQEIKGFYQQEVARVASLQASNTKGGSLGAFGAGNRIEAEKSSKALSSLAEEASVSKLSLKEFSLNLAVAYGTIYSISTLVGNSLGVFNEKLGDGVKELGNAIFGLIAIQQIGKNFGGLKLKLDNILPKGIGDTNFSRGIGVGRKGLGSSANNLLAGPSFGAKAGVLAGKAISGISSFGTALAGSLPVIGQVVAGLFVFNSVLKAFGVDVITPIARSLGVLSEAGLKAKESFETFASKLKDPSGITGAQLAAKGQARLEALDARAALRGSGEDVTGLTDTDAIRKAAEKKIRDSLGDYVLFVSEGYRMAVSSGGLGGVTQVDIPGVAKTYKDLSNEGQKIFEEQTSFFAELTEDQLRTFSKIQPSLKSSSDLPLEELRTKILQFAAESASSTIDKSKGTSEASFLKQTQTFLSSLAISVGTQLDNVAKEVEKSNPAQAVRVDIQELIRKRTEFVNLFAIDAKRISDTLNVLSGSSAFKSLGAGQQARLGGQIELRQLNLNFVSDAAKSIGGIYNDVLTTLESNFSLKNEETAGKLKPLLEGLDVTDTSKLSSSLQKITDLLAGTDIPLDKVNDLQRKSLETGQVLLNTYNAEKNILLLNQSLKIKEADLIDKFNRGMIDVNNTIRQFELDNIRLRGQQDVVDIRKDLALTFADVGASSPEEAFSRRQQIEADAFAKRQSLEKQILDNQLRIETRRETYTQENIFALNANTKKLEELTQANLVGGLPSLEARRADLVGQREALGGDVAIDQTLADRISKEISSIDGIIKNVFEPLESSLFKSQDLDMSSLLDKYLNKQVGFGSGSFEDIEKTLREQFTSVEFNDTLLNSAAKTIQNWISTLETNAETLSVQTDVFKESAAAEKKKADAGNRYAVALAQQIISLRDQANTSLISSGERSSLLRQADRLSGFQGLNQEQLSKKLSSSGQGFFDFVDEASVRAQDFNRDFTYTVATEFRNGLTGAISDAISGTKTLKESLVDAALSFAKTLQDKALNQLADLLFTGGGSGNTGNIVSSVLGLFSRSGGVQTAATGGKITGGSGTKDDVPTLLMGGEYVINKKSVQKYGPEFFSALNNGSIQGMATGGQYMPGTYGQKAIRGNNLLKFAGQQGTSGVNDQISNFGGGAAFVGLEPESARLTNFGRQLDTPMNQAVRQTREQALALYFQGLSAQAQFKEQEKAAADAEKEKMKQLLISLGIAVVGGAVSGYAGSLANRGTGGNGSMYGQNSLPTYDVNNQYMGTTPAGQPIRSNVNLPVQSYSSASNLSPGTTRSLSNLSSLPQNRGFQGVNSPSYIQPLLPPPNYRNAGGMVNGNGYKDSVPAMLSGGEFVLNNKAAKNIGSANLNAANSGQSLGVSEEKSEELNERLIAALNDLGEKMSNQTSISVTVNSDTGKSTTSENGNSNDQQKRMTRQIEEAVVQIIQKEKRIGGSLYR